MLNIMYNNAFVGPDNAKCLMLPVKSVLHYFKYSDRVQAYSASES